MHRSGTSRVFVYIVCLFILFVCLLVWYFLQPTHLCDVPHDMLARLRLSAARLPCKAKLKSSVNNINNVTSVNNVNSDNNAAWLPCKAKLPQIFLVLGCILLGSRQICLLLFWSSQFNIGDPNSHMRRWEVLGWITQWVIYWSCLWSNSPPQPYSNSNIHLIWQCRCPSRSYASTCKQRPQSQTGEAHAQKSRVLIKQVRSLLNDETG